MKSPVPFLLLLIACGPVVPVGAGGGGGSTGGGGGTTTDSGLLDAGALDAGLPDAGLPDAGPLDAGLDAGTILPDLGWTFLGVPGSQCALGAQAGLGYNPGASDELVLFLNGGGACWNNGTCQPSLYRWGPVCNYGSDSVCLWDDAGGTKPLAANVSLPDPYPADGGGVFPADLATIRSSLLFARRAENHLRNATYVFVPYCTGDLHAGNATRTYYTKGGLFDQPVARTHHFAGATNMDAYLATLRARHPVVHTIWLTGVSGGGYGASLNLERVRGAFPEATVHLLADSAPMVQPGSFEDWKSEWNLQLPSGCANCDAGFPQIIQYLIDDQPTSRVALLAYSEDQVITRFMYSGGDTNSWLNPPYGTYSTNLAALETRYEASTNARYFQLPGQNHVMVQLYGVVQPDGGLSAPAASRDGGTDLRAWLDAWETGVGRWENQK